MLAVGSGRGGIEINPDGCALRMNMLGATTVAMPVTTGAISMPLAIPSGLGVWTATFQAFALAPNEARLFVARPGVAVEFH